MTQDRRDPFNVEAVRISKTLPEDRRMEFIEYVMKDTASDAFMKYLETDEAARKAVETAQDAKAELLVKKMQELADIARYLQKALDDTLKPVKPAVFTAPKP